MNEAVRARAAGAQAVRLKVVLLSLPPRTQAMLEYFMAGAGRAAFVATGEAQAEAAIYDHDNLGSRQHWEAYRQGSGRPGIMLSVQAQEVAGAVWVQKPATPAALMAAAARLAAGEVAAAAPAPAAAQVPAPARALVQAPTPRHAPTPTPTPISPKPAVMAPVVPMAAPQSRWPMPGAATAPVMAPAAAPVASPVAPTPQVPAAASPTEPVHAAAEPAPAPAPHPPASEPRAEPPAAAEPIAPAEAEAAPEAAPAPVPAPVAEAPTEAPPAATERTRPPLAPVLDEAEVRLLCGERADVAPSALKADASAFFSAKGTLLEAVGEAWRVARKWNSVTLLETAAGALVIDAAANRAHLGFGLAELAALSQGPVGSPGGPAQRVRMLTTRELTQWQAEPGRLKTSLHADALVWRVALLVSRGRLPAGTDPAAVVYLKHWPNATRLPATPEVLRVSALLAERGASVVEAAKTLGVAQRHVFACYNGLAALDLTTHDGAQLKRRQRKNTRGRTLFNRLFRWLRGQG